MRTALLAAFPAAHAGRSAVGLGRRLGGRSADAVAVVLHPAGQVLVRLLARLLDPSTVSARHLLLQRVAWGLVGVLCSLGSTVPVDEEVRRWLPGYGGGSARP